MILSIKSLNKLLLYATFFFLLFVPKVNIIEFSFSYVGAKPEDVWFLFLFTCSIIQFYLFRRNKWLKLYNGKYIILFICLSVFFAILNGFTIKNIAFIGRYVEYFSFLWFGILLSLNTSDIMKSKLLSNMIKIAFIYWVLISFLGDMSIEGRKNAIFSHPTELAGVTLFVSWLYAGLQEKITNKFIVITIGCVLIALSESRATLVTMFLLILWTNKSYIAEKKKILFIIVLVASLLFLNYADVNLDDEGKFSRITSILTIDTLEMAVDNFSTANPEELADVSNPYVAEKDGDLSLNIRITKWGIVLANVAQNFFLLGLGAGNIGEGIDGFYIRVLGENGIIGLVLFILVVKMLFSSVSKNNNTRMLKLGTVGLMMNACFIDIFYFSRVACIFWFTWGCVIANYNERIPN